MKSSIYLHVIIVVVFLLAGLACTHFSFQPDSPKAIADKIAGHLKDELEVVEEDFPTIAIDRPYQTDIDKIRYPFFIYSNNRLIYWSDNSYIPSPQAVSDTFQVKLIRTGSEAYIVKKKIIDEKKFIVFALLLQRRYTINNDYLAPEWNQKILSSGNVTILDPAATAGIPVCIDENCIFRINYLRGDFPTHEALRVMALICLCIALVIFLLLIYRGLAMKWLKYFPELGFFYLYFIFYIIRTVMINSGLPGNFIRSSLFDPSVFASSSLNSSLGDLLINMLCVLALCHYVFRSYPKFRTLTWKKHTVVVWITMFLSSLFILYAGLFPFVVIQTIYNNSALTLDISQLLEFDLLRVVAVLIVVLSGICAFLFSHAFIRILANDRNKVRSIFSFAAAIAFFALVNSLTQQQYLFSLIVTIIYVAMVYILGLYASLKQLSYTTFAYLFAAIFFLSAGGAYGIQYFSDKEKIENQFRFASNFLIDRDYFGEYLLNEASHKIANDAFTQLRVVTPFLGKEAVRAKIRQVFLPSYFNKYDVEIYIFNNAGEPLDNKFSSPLSDVINQYNQDDYRTIYEGIYFVNNPESDITQKYLMVIPIRRSGTPAGYIIIELSLKRIIPENVYPELLVDYSFQQYYRTRDLSYAVFFA